MGSRADLGELIAFLRTSGVRPHIDRTLPLAKAGDGFAAMESGELVGKIVIEV